MPLPDHACPTQSKQLSWYRSPTIIWSFFELSGIFILQSVLFSCLVSLTQHFVSMLLHILLGCSILLNSVLLCECATTCLFYWRWPLELFPVWGYYEQMFLYMPSYFSQAQRMKSASLITGRPTVPKPLFSSAFLVYHFSEYIQVLTAAIFNFYTSVSLPVLYYLASEEKKHHR